MITDTVLRWDDGHQMSPLADQLRSRPGCWAIIDENLPHATMTARVAGLTARLGDGFEVSAASTDDGPYGVLFEIHARAVED